MPLVDLTQNDSSIGALGDAWPAAPRVFGYGWPQAATLGGSRRRRVRRVRVVVADDAVLLREGVARLLAEAGMEIVGTAADAEELLLKVRSYQPDVAIVDIRMPPTHTNEGLLAAQEIREKHPDVGVLLLSQYVEAGFAFELLADNAEGVGYLLKDRVSNVEDFTAAVRRVGEGGSALDPEVVSRLLGRHRRDDPLAELTPREREVLGLMAEGLSNAAIAGRIVVTERAVEKHVTKHLPETALAYRPGDPSARARRARVPARPRRELAVPGNAGPSATMQAMTQTVLIVDDHAGLPGERTLDARGRRLQRRRRGCERR